MGTEEKKPQEPNTAKSVASVSPPSTPNPTVSNPGKVPVIPEKSNEDRLKEEINLRTQQLNEIDTTRKAEIDSHKSQIENLANDRDNLKEELLHLKRAFDRIEVDHYARLERIKEVFKTSGMDTMQQAKVFAELKDILEW